MNANERFIMEKLEDPEILEFYRNKRNVFFRTPVHTDENLMVQRKTLEITVPPDCRYSDLEDVLAFYINREMQRIHFFDWDIRLDRLTDEIGEEKALDQSEELYDERYVTFDIVRIKEDSERDPEPVCESVSNENIDVDPEILKEAVRQCRLPKGKERIFSIRRPKLRNMPVNTEDEVKTIKLKITERFPKDMDTFSSASCIILAERALRFLHLCRYIGKMEMLAQKEGIESALKKSEELFEERAFSVKGVRTPE